MEYVDIVEWPRADIAERLAVSAPANPFYSAAYGAARGLLGWNARVLAQGEPGHREMLCPVFTREGLSGGCLEIPSLPVLPAGVGFWTAFLDACRRHDIVSVEVATFGSTQAAIPRLPEEQERRERWEYVLELQAPDLWAGLSSNHRRNVLRGRKNGIQVRRSVDPAARARHVELMAASMDRRKDRGECVPDVHGYMRREVNAFVDAGAGALFQAVKGESVVSSILVLLAPDGGYYHSAGTSAEGLRCGASHLLVQEIAAALRGEGKHTFNLGGVGTAGSGLDQFKSGFGGRRIVLAAVRLAVRRRVTRWLGAGVKMLRQAALSGGTR